MVKFSTVSSASCSTFWIVGSGPSLPKLCGRPYHRIACIRMHPISRLCFNFWLTYMQTSEEYWANICHYGYHGDHFFVDNGWFAFCAVFRVWNKSVRLSLVADTRVIIHGVITAMVGRFPPRIPLHVAFLGIYTNWSACFVLEYTWGASWDFTRIHIGEHVFAGATAASHCGFVTCSGSSTCPAAICCTGPSTWQYVFETHHKPHFQQRGLNPTKCWAATGLGRQCLFVNVRIPPVHLFGKASVFLSLS